MLQALPHIDIGAVPSMILMHGPQTVFLATLGDQVSDNNLGQSTRVGVTGHFEIQASKLLAARLGQSRLAG